MGRLIAIALMLVAAGSLARPAGAQDTCFRLPATYLSKDVTLRVHPGGNDLCTPESRGPDGEWGEDLVEFLARQSSRIR